MRAAFQRATGTPFNDLQHSTDIVLLAVLWRLRYKLSFRDVAELLLERGYAVTHETIPRLGVPLRAALGGTAADQAAWPRRRFLVHRRNLCEGRRTLVLPVSRHRSGGDADRFDVERAPRQHAARRFLRGLLQVAERKPLRITTDGHPAYRKAIRWIIGRTMRHRCNQYLNNAIEQDHRAIKQRYYPMRGFGSFVAAAQFCPAFDEVRQYFRVRQRGAEWMPLAEQRRIFIRRWRFLIREMQTA